MSHRISAVCLASEIHWSISSLVARVKRGQGWPELVRKQASKMEIIIYYWQFKMCTNTDNVPIYLSYRNLDIAGNCYPTLASPDWVLIVKVYNSVVGWCKSFAILIKANRKNACYSFFSGWWDIFPFVTKEALFQQPANSGLLRFSFV